MNLLVSLTEFGNLFQGWQANESKNVISQNQHTGLGRFDILGGDFTVVVHQVVADTAKDRHQQTAGRKRCDGLFGHFEVFRWEWRWTFGNPIIRLGGLSGWGSWTGQRAFRKSNQTFDAIYPQNSHRTNTRTRTMDCKQLNATNKKHRFSVNSLENLARVLFGCGRSNGAVSGF